MSIVEPTPSVIADAAALLRSGRLVAFPTETVYGLAADATNDHAVAAIFAAKGRPRFNPLIVHVRDQVAAQRLGLFSETALELAAHYWPGPLTLVVPRHPQSIASRLVSAGLDSIAVRVPAHPVALHLLAAVDRPLAAPSANPSGRISPTTARHVAAGLTVAMILDGGACSVGLESTVLDLTGERPVLLRPGGIAAETLEKMLGPLAARLPNGTESVAGWKSPGLMASHYAPRLMVRMDAEQALPGEALLGFGSPAPPGVTLNLSPAGDLVDAAANLFAMLHALDRPDVFSAIAVMPIPERGLGAAINDRLRRAAAPRLMAPTATAP